MARGMFRTGVGPGQTASSFFRFQSRRRARSAGYCRLATRTRLQEQAEAFRETVEAIAEPWPKLLFPGAQELCFATQVKNASNLRQLKTLTCRYNGRQRLAMDIALKTSRVGPTRSKRLRGRSRFGRCPEVVEVTRPGAAQQEPSR